MDINEELKKQREQIAKLTRDLENSTQELNAAKDYYENIIALMPGHVYWMDKNNVFLGCNDLQAKAAKLIRFGKIKQLHWMHLI
jgi:two-component system aerobic respiration control sensor histidine kinase ArcB